MKTVFVLAFHTTAYQGKENVMTYKMCLISFKYVTMQTIFMQNIVVLFWSEIWSGHFLRFNQRFFSNMNILF